MRSAMKEAIQGSACSGARASRPQTTRFSHPRRLFRPPSLPTEAQFICKSGRDARSPSQRVANRCTPSRAMGSAGFTLVEMVVAVTLIVMISLVLWVALRISIASWRRGTETMDENQRSRATMDLMQKQMASVSAIVPPLNLQLGIVQNPIFAGTEAGIQFVSQCSLRFRDNPGLTFISYEIVPAEQGEFALIERETRYLGGDPTQTVSFEGSNEPVTTIFNHLARAWFEYLDPGDEQVPAQWVASWDSADAGRLPAAISLSVSAYGPNRTVQNRQLVIPLMAEPDNNPQGFTDPFEGRMGGGPGIMGPPGRGGPGDVGRGRGGQGDRRGGPGEPGRGRGGPGEPGRGRGGPGMGGPGFPGRGGMPGINPGRGRGPGDVNPLPPGGRRGGR